MSTERQVRTHRIPQMSQALAVPLLGLALAAVDLPAQQYADDAYQRDGYAPEITARVWFDRGDEPVVDRGDRLRVYYRASADAYVAIFNIDTNGTVRMLYPRSPEDNNWVRGGRDYRLLFPRSPYWYVDDQPGLGYYFVVASPEPFDMSLLDFSYYDHGWDLSHVGRTVYRDPYVAMDDYVAALIPDWQYVPYALDFATYHVGQERYDYPRFMCYDCHGFRSYTSWNPYHYHCTNFRVVIYDDPWYYPAYRYSGRRVVYSGYPRADIPRANLPRYEFKERADGEPGPPLVATRAAGGTTGARPGLPDTPVRRPAVPGAGGDDRRAAPTGSAPAPGNATRRPGVPDDVGAPRRGDPSGAAGPVTRRPGGSPAAGAPEPRRTDPSAPSAGTPRSGTPTTGVRRPAGSAGAPTARPGGAAERPTRPSSGGESDAPAVRRPSANAGGAAEERRWVPVVRPRSEPTGERSRPVLERRPSTERESTGRGDPAPRPTSRVLPPSRPTSSTPSRGGGSATPAIPRSGGGGSTGPAIPRSGGGGTARPAPPPRGSGGSGSSARPATPSRTPTTRSAPSSGTTSRGTPSARPTPSTRRGGGGGTATTPSRPTPRALPRSGGGTQPSARPAPRSSGGGTARSSTPTRQATPTRTPARPRVTPRSGGGGSSASTPAPAPSRTPARVPRRGGGGGGGEG